jgi:hypothetical protein
VILQELQLLQHFIHGAEMNIENWKGNQLAVRKDHVPGMANIKSQYQHMCCPLQCLRAGDLAADKRFRKGTITIGVTC